MMSEGGMVEVSGSARKRAAGDERGQLSSQRKEQDWIPVQVQIMSQGEGGCSERVQRVQWRLWRDAGKERAQLVSQQQSVQDGLVECLQVVPRCALWKEG